MSVHYCELEHEGERRFSARYVCVCEKVCVCECLRGEERERVVSAKRLVEKDERH